MGGMSTFLVMVRRFGPPDREELASTLAQFLDDLAEEGFMHLGGPLPDEHRIVMAVEAESEAAVRARFEDDPWAAYYMKVDSIVGWDFKAEDGQDTQRIPLQVPVWPEH